MVIIINCVIYLAAETADTMNCCTILINHHLHTSVCVCACVPVCVCVLYVLLRSGKYLLSIWSHTDSDAVPPADVGGGVEEDKLCEQSKRPHKCSIGIMSGELRPIYTTFSYIFLSIRPRPYTPFVIFFCVGIHRNTIFPIDGTECHYKWH